MPEREWRGDLNKFHSWHSHQGFSPFYFHDHFMWLCPWRKKKKLRWHNGPSGSSSDTKRLDELGEKSIRKPHKSKMEMQEEAGAEQWVSVSGVSFGESRVNEGPTQSEELQLYLDSRSHFVQVYELILTNSRYTKHSKLQPSVWSSSSTNTVYKSYFLN